MLQSNVLIYNNIIINIKGGLINGQDLFTGRNFSRRKAGRKRIAGSSKAGIRDILVVGCSSSEVQEQKLAALPVKLLTLHF